jgi:hypothetical protein
VGLERGPLSFVSIIEELVERKSSGCGLESRECGLRDPSRWPRGILYSQKLALTSLISGIVLSRTQVTECLYKSHRALRATVIIPRSSANWTVHSYPSCLQFALVSPESKSWQDSSSVAPDWLDLEIVTFCQCTY